MEDGAPDDPPSWIERFDPQAQLDVLAAALADDLRGQVTNVAIARAGRRLTLGDVPLDVEKRKKALPA